MARTSKPAPDAPEPKDDDEVTLLGAAVEPFAIGPTAPAGTPGFYMGISAVPQTPAEHATRLGAAAGKFNDAGFLLGNLEPRSGWPMGNVAE